MAQATAATTIFDPSQTMHYALSEESQFRLHDIRIGLRTIGHMFEQFPLEDRVEVQSDDIASLFRAFSYGVEAVLSAAPFCGPSVS